MTDVHSVSFQYLDEDIMNVVIETLGFDIGRCWLILLCIITLLGVAGYGFWLNSFIFSGFCVVMAILVVPIYIVVAYFNLSSALSSLTSCVYTIENNQFVAGSNYGFHYFDFKDINRVVITKPMIFVYVSKRNAYFIPIRAFHTSEKANKFITALQYGIEIAKRDTENTEVVSEN